LESAWAAPRKSGFRILKSLSQPVWTPDGKRLIYWSSPTGLVNTPGELRSIPADNSGPPTTIMTSPVWLLPSSISPDGKTLLVSKIRDPNLDVFVVPLDSPGKDGSDMKPRAFVQSEKFSQSGARFSPDGHWVAYSSNESGKSEVYVVPYPGRGGKTPVSVDGGVVPVWNRNGRELFYASGRKVMAVEVQTSPTFSAGTPKVLFEAGFAALGDVSPDGRRFLGSKPAAAPEQSDDLHVVLNWFEEIRQRAK
jgi:eukaryotic-like serine/threonine-protein kinase